MSEPAWALNHRGVRPMTSADAAVLRAAAAIVEVRAQTHPHLIALRNRILALADQLTPEHADDHEDTDA